MKNKISLVILLFCTVSAFSQAGSNSITMSNEFAMLAAHGGTGSSFSTFQSYSNNQVNGSQFFLPDWSKGEIALNSKEVFKKGILLAYDKVRQELFIKQQDAPDILLGTKEEIKYVQFMGCGQRISFRQLVGLFEGKAGSILPGAGIGSVKAHVIEIYKRNFC